MADARRAPISGENAAGEAVSRDRHAMSRDRHALRFVTQRNGNGRETFLKRFIDAEATHRRPCAIGAAAWVQIESDAGATHRQGGYQPDTLPLTA